MKSPFFFFSLSAAALFSAKDCAPENPATCYPEPCNCTYCLGPKNEGVNAPVHPFICNGDWEITLAGVCWKSYQDGLEYAIETETQSNTANRYKLVNANFINPHFTWNFGFKFGLGYNTTCDGWNIGILWTHYKGKAFSHKEAEPEENTTILTLWSGQILGVGVGRPHFATDVEAQWSCPLNLVDIVLGRTFWNSSRVALRPYAGIQIGSIIQDYDITYKGGTWSNLTTLEIANDSIHLDNDFKGTGITVGLDSNWHFGCGWSLYGKGALSQIYGRFYFDHKEMNRNAEAPFNKTSILETKDSFRSTSLFVNLAFGIEYFVLLCDCTYAFGMTFGWEQYLFLHQNQMWRVNPQQANDAIDIKQIFNKRRGDLSIQGWTLKAVFDF